MNNQLLLPLFIIKLFTSLFAAPSTHEGNTLPLKSSSRLQSYIQPALPQLKINYNPLPPDTNHTEYLQNFLNFEKDDSTYCPHIEILTRIINELRNLIPEGGDKIKDVLSNYYTILENSLNNKYDVQSLRQLSSENRLHYINSLAQKLISMDDKNAKIKISFEYELPTIHKAMCEKLCNDLINYANSENIPEIHDLNYAHEQGKMKNNIMTFLQNYRPNNINSKSSSHIKFHKADYLYPPSADALPSNPVPPKLKVSNLQSMSQSLLNQKGSPISDPVPNFAPLLQSPTGTVLYSKPNVSHIPPWSRPKGKANFISLQNLATQFHKNPKIAGPAENLQSYNLQNLAFQLPSLIETENTATHSTHLSPQWLEPKRPLNKSPFQHSIPILQSYIESSNFYPLQSLAQLGRTDINPLQIVAPPMPNHKGNIHSLQKAAHFSQDPISPEDSYPIQSLPPHLQRLTENAKNIDKLAKQNYDDYNSNQNSQYIHNNKINVAQYISKNNRTFVTPTISENRWSQPNDVPTNNKYSNSEKLLQEMLIQSYNQHKPPALNIVPGANKHYPVNFYQNLNADTLSNIKQYEIGKLETDSSSAQASALDYYKQYLQLVKNLIKPQTNTGTGNFLNLQVSPPPNSYQLSHEKNNALYNTYVKKNNQLATQYDIPNSLAVSPKTYNYYNPNLDITNTAKDTQESYSVQFQDLHRLLGVSNLDKLNSASSKNGIVELTYKLNHSKPSGEPFFYVKYRLPYDIFMFNLYKLLFEKPDLRKDLQLLYKDLLIGSNITSSSVLKNLDKDELLRLVSTNGTLVTAKVLNAKDTTASEQIKIIQRLNADMPLKDIIVKTDANITKVTDLTSNIHLINYLKDRLNYLNDLQSQIALNQYYLNPYNPQANQNYYQYVRYPSYLANTKPTLLYNYFQNKQSYPYSQYGLNTFSRYFGYRG